MGEIVTDAAAAHPPVRSDPRARRTAAALLQAGERLFAERGLDEVTVEEIAANAKVAINSIYNHFGSKLALYAAVIERAVDRNRDFMDRAYTADRSPVEQIRAAGQEYFRFYRDYPEFFRALAFPPDPGSYPAGRELLVRLTRRADEQNARLADALRRGIAAGAIRDLDPARTATTLWAAWNGIISLAWRPDTLRHDPERLGDLIVTATDVVMRGILAPGVER